MANGKKGATPPGGDWVEDFEKAAAIETELRMSVLRLRREELRENNDPAAKRELQRHHLAVSLANGLLCGGSGTLAEKLRLAADADLDALAVLAYMAAEKMLQHREVMKELEAPTACTCRAIIAADESRHFRECPLRAKYPEPAKR